MEDSNELASYYDLIILGTGYVESLVSCAVSKRIHAENHKIGNDSSGNNHVLHLDANDYYGGSLASISLSTILENSQQQKEVDNASDSDDDGKSLKLSPIAEEKLRVPVYSIGEEDCLKYHKIITDAKNKAPGYLNTANSIKTSEYWHPSMVNLLHRPSPYQPMQSPLASQSNEAPDSTHLHPAYFYFDKSHKSLRFEAMRRDRDFSINLSTKALYCAGKSIDYLVSSGVSEYLEFKVLDALSYLLSLDGNKVKSGQYSSYFWRVPCTKKDIFCSTELTALEKRALMKFQQFVADYNNALVQGQQVESVNESEQLAQGRSLHRPQNKANQVQSAGLDLSEYEHRPFRDLLVSFGLSPKLQQLIEYALCFHDCANDDDSSERRPADAVWESGRAMRELCLHINALGKFGETAFLLPLYGMGELLQGYCRMSAVWGSTFVLRRPIRAITLSNDNTSSPSVRVIDLTGQSIECKNLLLNASYLPKELIAIDTNLFAYQFIVVLSARILPQEKSLLVIPPQYQLRRPAAAALSLKNGFAVRILQQDHDVGVCPAGCFVLLAQTFVPYSTVVPPAGAKLSDWPALAEQHRSALRQFTADLWEVLREVRNHDLLPGDQLSADNSAVIYAQAFIEPLFDLSATKDLLSKTVEHAAERIHLCSGMTYHAKKFLHLEHDSESAREIFRAVYPGDLGDSRDLFEQPEENNDNDNNGDVDDNNNVVSESVESSDATQVVVDSYHSNDNNNNDSISNSNDEVIGHAKNNRIEEEDEELLMMKMALQQLQQDDNQL